MSKLCCITVFSCVLFFGTVGDERDPQPTASKTKQVTIGELTPELDHQEVTITFKVLELGGVAQRSRPEKPSTFIIETAPEHETKSLNIWVENELADVLERLQLSYIGSNPIAKDTRITATGKLTFSPGAGESKGREWYQLRVGKWQNFRILPTEKNP